MYKSVRRSRFLFLGRAKENLSCRLPFSFNFLDLEWHDFPLPFNCSLESLKFIVLNWVYTFRVVWRCLPSKCNTFWAFRHSKFLELWLGGDLRVRKPLYRFLFELCRVPPSWLRVSLLQSPSGFVGRRDHLHRILSLWPFCCGERLFYVLALFLARQLHSWLRRQVRALHVDFPRWPGSQCRRRFAKWVQLTQWVWPPLSCTWVEKVTRQ